MSAPFPRVILHKTKRMQENRTFRNPRIKDVVTIIKSAEETGGAYILVEVALMPGGGTIMHYHTSFAEEFIPIAGVLGIEIEKQKLLLRPGRRATAQVGQLHRFFNPGKTTIRFQVRISPGIERFTDALRIGYGLAAAGKTNKKGIPRNLDHLAILLELSDTRFSGFLSLLESFLIRRARKARKRGVERELYRLYC